MKKLLPVWRFLSRDASIGAVALCGLVGGWLWGRDNWQIVPAPPHPVLFQVPSDQLVLSGIEKAGVARHLFADGGSLLEISGWTTSTQEKTKVKTILIRIGGKPAATVDNFFPRPDVSDAFGRPDFEMSGWRTGISLKEFAPGDYPISFQVQLEDGRSAPLPDVKLTIMK